MNGESECNLQGAWWRVERQLSWDDDRCCLRHHTACGALSSSMLACSLSLLVSTALLYLSSRHNTPSPTPSPQHFAICHLTHTLERAYPTRNWTFTTTRSLNGDGERSCHHKHRHHQLANIYTKAKISLASEAPAAHLVRPVTTIRRETRRTSRSMSRRHSQPPVSAARRESKPVLLPPRNYPQSIRQQDAS